MAGKGKGMSVVIAVGGPKGASKGAPKGGFAPTRTPKMGGAKKSPKAPMMPPKGPKGPMMPPTFVGM